MTVEAEQMLRQTLELDKKLSGPVLWENDQDLANGLNCMI